MMSSESIEIAALRLRVAELEAEIAGQSEIIMSSDEKDELLRINSAMGIRNDNRGWLDQARVLHMLVQDYKQRTSGRGTPTAKGDHLSNPDKIPLDQMTDAEIGALWRAGMDGRQYFHHGKDRWCNNTDDELWHHIIYRLKHTADKIRFDLLPPEVVCTARDAMGEVSAFSGYPTSYNYCWSGKGNERLITGLQHIPSICTPGTVHWTKSLVYAPGKEPKGGAK